MIGTNMKIFNRELRKKRGRADERQSMIDISWEIGWPVVPGGAGAGELMAIPSGDE